MSETGQSPDGRVLLALTRPLLAELLDPAAAQRLRRIAPRLDRAVDAVVLGVDLVEPTAAAAERAGSAAPGLDPTIAAVTLAHHTERVGLVVAAAPQRDHPYNLARRLATLDHASGGRIGLLVGTRDPVATAGAAWTAAAPAEAAAGAVTAIRELWRSFPVDAVVGDRETGVFAESHRILAIDHRGAFDVTGPLQVPTGPQVWPPVLGWSDTVGGTADLVVDGRFAVRRPTTLDELERAVDGDLPGPLAPLTLRARLGLGPAEPPTTGRPVFLEPRKVPTP